MINSTTKYPPQAGALPATCLPNYVMQENKVRSTTLIYVNIGLKQDGGLVVY